MSRLFRSALLLAFFFGLEKALGFIRQVAIARSFGLSATLDAFNASNNIPDLIFTLISGGALSLAFIPVLSEYLHKRGRSEMWDLFSQLVNLVFLVTASLSLIVALLAPWLVRWQLGVAPGFTAEQQSLVADLMRLHLLATLCLSLGGLAAGSLQTNQHFFLPALAPSMYDLGMLFGILVLVPEQRLNLGPLALPAFGLGIYGLVYGAILGSVLFLCVQLPGLRTYGFRWRPQLNLRHPGLQQMLHLLGPRLVNVLSIQLAAIGQDNIASRLATGSISALVYGWLFMQVPETLIGTAIGTVLLPTLSEQQARQDHTAYLASLQRAVRVLLALTLPAAAVISVVLGPVIAILGLDVSSSDLVLWTARLFLLGLAGHSLLEVAVRAFYAQQNARLPMIAAIATALGFLVLAILLGFPLGAPGIALANSLAFSLQAIVLLVILNLRAGNFLKVTSSLVRSLSGALLGAGLAALVLNAPFGLPPLVLAVAGGVLGILGALPFILPELRLLIKL